MRMLAVWDVVMKTVCSGVSVSSGWCVLYGNGRWWASRTVKGMAAGRRAARCDAAAGAARTRCWRAGYARLGTAAAGRRPVGGSSWSSGDGCRRTGVGCGRAGRAGRLAVAAAAAAAAAVVVVVWSTSGRLLSIWRRRRCGGRVVGGSAAVLADGVGNGADVGSRTVCPGIHTRGSVRWRLRNVPSNVLGLVAECRAERTW